MLPHIIEHQALLTCHLQRSLTSVGVTEAEQKAAHVFLGKHADQTIRQIVNPRVSDTIECLIIGQLIHLPIDRLLDLGPVVANVDVPQTAKTIEQFVVISILNIVSVTMGDDQGIFLRGGCGRPMGARLLISDRRWDAAA